MPRPSRLAILAALTAAVAAGAIGVASASVVGVPTKLTLSTTFPAFHGHVKSDRSVCERNRKVKMFREQSGSDHLLGTDKSNHDGKWKVPVNAGSGSYYAKVKIKTKVDANGNGVVCHKDHSRTVSID